jgi:tetratricopeptide (TPR) repeat protein
LEAQVFHKAKAALKRAIELDCNNAEYHALMGRIHHSLEEWKDAKAAFEHAAALDPRNPERYIELGATAFAQLKWDEALTHYESAKNLGPEPKILIMLRHLIVEVRGRRNHERRKEINGNIQSFVLEGNRLFSKEQWGEAEAAFEKAREIDPENPRRYLDLGATAFAQMDWSKALGLYKKGRALSSDPIIRYRFSQAISKAELYLRRQDPPRPKGRRYLRLATILLAITLLILVIYFVLR